MESLEQIFDRAERMGVPPSMLVKSILGRQLLASVASVEGLVLQGGGAVHHVYGSPRFSADLDYAQPEPISEDRLRTALDDVADLVTHDWRWGACKVDPPVSKGRLHRQKLRIALRPGSSLVLAVERYEVAVHRPRRLDVAGTNGRVVSVAVESPAEIVADKLVAGIDRWRTRGGLKLRDLYDIDRLLERESPDRRLVEQKLSDSGLPGDLDVLGEIAVSVGPLLREELREQLRDVLPLGELEELDIDRLLVQVRDLFQRLAP